MLQAVKPSVLICEEAAEILESHVLASLSSNIQQLVLIGNHEVKARLLIYVWHCCNYIPFCRPFFADSCLSSLAATAPKGSRFRVQCRLEARL